MNSRELQLLNPLLDFFSVDVNMKKFVDTVVLKKKKIPLRTYEWLVTNYAKKYNTRYTIQRQNGTNENFSLYAEYRAQLKGNKKTNFDPCCRGSTIELKYTYPDTSDEIVFQTAVRQLTFFKWAIENLVVEYVEANSDKIHTDMNNSKKNNSIPVISGGFFGTEQLVNVVV